MKLSASSKGDDFIVSYEARVNGMPSEDKDEVMLFTSGMAEIIRDIMELPEVMGDDPCGVRVLPLEEPMAHVAVTMGW